MYRIIRLDSPSVVATGLTYDQAFAQYEQLCRGAVILFNQCGEFPDYAIVLDR